LLTFDANVHVTQDRNLNWWFHSTLLMYCVTLCYSLSFTSSFTESMDVGNMLHCAVS